MLALSQLFEYVLAAMMGIACALLFAMVVMIGADVLLRNVGAGGFAPSNELSEDFLYLMAILSSPWLLRQGQHIRVDIVLRILPGRTAWLLEWIGDITGFVCCLFFVWYGARMALESHAAGSLSIKTLITPEWWLLAPLPVVFALMAVEFIFRMHRLSLSERAVRDDAVSAG